MVMIYFARCVFVRQMTFTTRNRLSLIILVAFLNISEGAVRQIINVLGSPFSIHAVFVLVNPCLSLLHRPIFRLVKNEFLNLSRAVRVAFQFTNNSFDSFIFTDGYRAETIIHKKVSITNRNMNKILRLLRILMR